MIVVNLKAGLANQMFQYAFGRGLEAKGLKIYFDQYNFKPRKEMTCESVRLQDVFPNIDLRVMPNGHFKYVSRDCGILKRFYFKMMRGVLSYANIEKYIYEDCYGYTPNMEKRATENCIYYGHWQSEKYFKHCEYDIRKQFSFSPFDEEKNIQLAKKLQSENSVAIHFRKGKDYLPMCEKLNLCPVEYYNNAIAYIKEHVDNPVFYIFTDNKDWVEQNISGIDYTLVNWNPLSGEKNYRDMQLMTYAKHNIIANSTYSWWGAWLNMNPDKIVIAPKNFFGTEGFFSTSNIVCDGWISF